MQRYNIPGRVEQSSSKPPTQLFDTDGLVGKDSNGNADSPARSIASQALVADQDVRIDSDELTFRDSATTFTVEKTSRKGAASGYASLDASTEVVEPVQKITTATVPNAAGEVRIDGDALKYFGTGLHTTGIYEQVPIACAAPSAIRLMGTGGTRQGFVADRVYISAAVLPAAPGDSFSWNIYVPGSGDLFAADQVYDYSPDVTGFGVTTDNETTFTSYLTEVTGAGTAPLGGLDTGANGDYFYVGFTGMFSGIDVDMDGANVNAQAAALTGEYWNGAAWTLLTITDGTDAAGATLAKDGPITWDCPVDWANRVVGTLGTKYWVRFNHDGAGALTAGTAIDSVDVRRTPGAEYVHLPDQNQTIPADSLLKVHCTEADAAAERVFIRVSGAL